MSDTPEIGRIRLLLALNPAVESISRRDAQILAREVARLDALLSAETRERETGLALIAEALGESGTNPDGPAAAVFRELARVAEGICEDRAQVEGERDAARLLLEQCRSGGALLGNAVTMLRGERDVALRDLAAVRGRIEALTTKWETEARGYVMRIEGDDFISLKGATLRECAEQARSLLTKEGTAP